MRRRRLPQLRLRLRTLIDRWALQRATQRPERNPKIVAILTVTGMNLTPTALGLQPLPNSMSNAPDSLGQFAVAFAVLGCFGCVAGLMMPSRWRDQGLDIEIAGTILLAWGFLFYAGALWEFTQPEDRAYAFGVAFGIGIGSLLRAGQIGLYVRGRRLADKEPAREIS